MQPINSSVAPGIAESQDTLKRTGSDRHTQILHICIDCGGKHWVGLRHGEPRSLRCDACRINALSQKDQYGVNNAAWKGGRYTNYEGYILVHLHPANPLYPMTDTQGVVMEHRLLVAESLGRCLESEELIHHKNGIKGDNRLENLQIVSIQEHRKIHSSWLQCEICGYRGPDVCPHDFQELSGHASVKDFCVDFMACSQRQREKMAAIDREIEIRQSSPEYLAECRRILAVDGEF